MKNETHSGATLERSWSDLGATLERPWSDQERSEAMKSTCDLQILGEGLVFQAVCSAKRCKSVGY